MDVDPKGVAERAGRKTKQELEHGMAFNGLILNITFLVLFAAFIIYRQRMQTSVALLGVRRKLKRLETLKDGAHSQ